MKRYRIITKLADGSEIDEKVTARNKNDAVSRLMNNKDFREATEGKKVESFEIKPIPIEPIDEKRYTIRTASNKPGWYVVEDSGTGIRVEWKKKLYNITNRVLPPKKELEPADTATALREIGEYLYENFNEII